MGKVIISESVYGDLGKSVELSNGLVDIIVTIDVGPRIMRYGFDGKENILLGKSDLSVPAIHSEWKLYGGHRLWSSPEAFPRTYYPDNQAVQWGKIENGIRLTVENQSWVQIGKKIEITMDPESSMVSVSHTLVNKNAWPIETAAWAITCMKPGGFAVLPQPRPKTHFSDGAKGSRNITLWAYTNMTDDRVYWGDNYITLCHDPEKIEPIKFGVSNPAGWCAYAAANTLFIKRCEVHENAMYPDNNVHTEAYASDEYLEIESLSPLTLLEPEAGIDHTEEWSLYELEKAERDPNNEHALDSLLAPDT